LITLDDNEVTIPNSKFLTEPVASGNSGEFTMLVQQDFLIGFDQDVEHAKRLVEEALTSSCYFSMSRPWVVLVNQVVVDATIAVRLRAKAYVIELRYEKSFESDVTERVLSAFRDEKILMPHPLG
jgi:small-conductance mechanosensitive channel